MREEDRVTKQCHLEPRTVCRAPPLECFLHKEWPINLCYIFCPGALEVDV